MSLPIFTLRTHLLLDFLVLWILALPEAHPLLGQDQWVLLESPHLETISNAGDKRTRQVIGDLEMFRQVTTQLLSLPDMARLPVTVFVFKNDISFEPYKPLYEGQPASLSGFFNRRMDRNMIALDARSNWDPLRVIQHEYLHLITSYRRHPLPLWLSEGLAEFYSTFRTSSKQAIIGDLIPTHLEMIRQRGLYRMEYLLGLDRNSNVYNEQNKQGVFYAQSWLLVHYLTLGEGQRYQAYLADLLNRLDEGVDSVEAFPQAFPDLSLEELEENLREYARRPTARVLKFPLKKTDLELKFNIRPLREGAALAYLGDLLLQADRFEAAAQHYRRAVTLEPDSPHPYEGLAFLAWREDQRHEARLYIESAIARGSRSHLLHSQWAEIRMRALGLLEKQRGELDRGQLDPIEASIQKSIQLAPGFDRGYYLLATLCLRTGHKLDRGLEAIRTALSLSPQNAYYKLTLADLYLATRDYRGARQVLRELQRATNPGIQQHAISRLESLRNLPASP